MTGAAGRDVPDLLARAQVEAAAARAAPWDRVHLVGVGGAGMSGIARILRARGAQVSGSDAKDSAALAALRALGVDVRLGHDAAHVPAAATVVASTAIRASNPELAVARQRAQPVLRRGAALAALLSGHRAVAVAGTHGKTTTTSLLTVALQAAGADPSFVIGADLNEAGSGAHHGSGAVFVAEADESDASFLLYEPEVAVVTNVEADHLDYYGTAAAVAAAFDAFAQRIAPGGTLVTNADDPGGAALAARARAAGVPVRTFAVRSAGGPVPPGPAGPAADLQVEVLALTAAGALATAAVDGVTVPLDLQLPGQHNVANAAAALLAGCSMGYDPAVLAHGMAAFRGARRRFEVRGTVRGVTVVDDYAHHPTELAAVLAAARAAAAGHQVLVAFQPHLFSRTQAFAAQFGAALGAADLAVVCEVYPAREDPVPGVSGQLVADAVPLPADRVLFAPGFAAAAAALAARARPGDLVLTVGAGDVTLLGPMVLAALDAGAGGAP